MSPLHCAAQYCRPKHVQVLYEGESMLIHLQQNYKMLLIISS